MERWNALPPILRHILLGAALFVMGGSISFWYSYRPLHGALTWKVESLEARLDERNHEFLRLRDEFDRLSKDDSERIEPETLAQIESELAKTKRALEKAEAESKALDKKRQDANASADRWRKRFESLRDQQVAASAAANPPAAPSSQPTTPDVEADPGTPPFQRPSTPARPGPSAASSTTPTTHGGSDVLPARDEPALP